MGSCCAGGTTPVVPKTNEQRMTEAKTSRATTTYRHNIMLGIGMFVGTIGSFGRMDYNIPIFAFEIIREKFFYNGWLGDKVEFTAPSTGYWYQPWNVIKAGGKYQAVYDDLQRQIYFKMHALALI